MALANNVIQTVNGDPSDPARDPILTGSNSISGRYGGGILLDIDWADPFGAGSYTGSFAPGDVIKSSCADHVVRRLIPGATAAQLGMTVGGAYTSSGIVVQRTSKGYPHVIVSQVNDTISSLLYLTVPDAILDYILANPTHQFRAAIEERITRADTYTANSGNPEFSIFATAAATGTFLFRMEGLNASSGGFRPLSGGSRLGIDAVPDLGQTLGERFKAIGVSSFTGTPPARAALTARYLFGTTITGQLHTGRSAIMRRLTLEDMTVSQAAVAAAVAAGSDTTELQTWAANDARHLAEWNRRKGMTDYYSGDTFNAPASVLP